MISLDRVSPPISQPIKQVKLLRPEVSKLANGVNVYQFNTGSQELLRLEFVFDAGVKYQSKSLVASTVSKTMKEGVTNRSAKEIADLLDYYGAFFNTEINNDKATITLYTLNKYLDEVLPVFKEILTEAIFPESEIQTYLHNSKQKYKIEQEKVDSICRKEFNRILFQDTPYGMMSEIEDFDQVKSSDLKSFFQNHYRNGKVEIFIAGKYGSKEFQSIQKQFDEVDFNTNATPFDFPELLDDGGQFYIEKEGAIQSALRIGKVMFTRSHQDYPAFQILNTVLGGYFGSRLMNNIREDKGYTYGIGSGLASMEHCGYFVISTEVGAEVTKDALKEIYSEIEKLQEELIPHEELMMVKNYMLGSFLRDSDGAFDMLDRFKNIHYSGLDYSYYDKYIHTINTVSPEHLQYLAQEYLEQDSFVEMVVGKMI